MTTHDPSQNPSPYEPPPAVDPYAQPYAAAAPVPPPYQPYGPPVPPPPAGTNGFAIASLVLGFFGICGAVLSTIFGIVALKQIRRTGQKGRGLAIAGLTLSALWGLGVVVAIVVNVLTDADRDSSGTITSEGNVSVNALKTGDCIKTVKDSSALFSLPAVPCSQAHQAEVVGDFELTGTGGSYPGESAIDDLAVERCEALLDSYTSDATMDLVEDLYYLYPRASDWRKGERTVTCLAITDLSHTGSLKG